MPKQRPGLTVNAAPISTFVAPQAAAAELYDAQSVNLALQFSEAFKDLSLSAANFYATLKTDSNKENLQAGIDLVNKNQKSYQDLVDAGEIKPSENPWLAVGAQQASGTMEGMRARSHFMSLYNQTAESDPKFFDNADGFNALAHQYTENMNTKIGDRAYLSRSFYEAFNPFIASTGMDHEQRVTEKNQQRVTMGVGAIIAQAWQDMDSPDPLVKNSALNVAQFNIDEMSRRGVSPTTINQTATKNILELMSKGKNPERGYKMFDVLQSGTGSMGKTEFAQYHLTLNKAQIEANRQTNSLEDLRQLNDFTDGLIAAVVDGRMPEPQAREAYRNRVSGTEAEKFTPSVAMAGENSITTESAKQINQQLRSEENAKQQIEIDAGRAKRLTADALKEATERKLNTMDELVLDINDSINKVGLWQGAEKEEAMRQDAIKRTREVADGQDITASAKLAYENRVETLFQIRSKAAAQAIEIQKAQAAQVEDLIYTNINDLSTNAPLELSNPLKNDELTVRQSTKLEAVMDHLNIPAEQRLKYRAKLLETLSQTAKIRELSFNLDRTSALWLPNQVTGSKGLAQEYLDDITQSATRGEIVDAMAYRSKIDSHLLEMGVGYDTPQAKPLLQDAYGKLSAIVDAQEVNAVNLPGFNGTLQDRAEDAVEVSQQKQMLRSMFMATRLTNAAAFENGEPGAKVMLNILNRASSLNEGNLPPDLVDSFKAIELAGRNNISWYRGAADSPNAKAVLAMSTYVNRAVSSGSSPQNAIIDAVHRLTAQRDTPFNFHDERNPFMWTNITGSGTDGKLLAENFVDERTRLDLFQTDALPYMARSKDDLFRKALLKSPDIDVAIKTSNAEFEKSHIMFRGSPIPRNGLPPKQNEEFVQAYLDAKFPGKNATLIVVLSNDTKVDFAIRDGEGNMIPGAGGLISKFDMIITPEIVQTMKTQRTDASKKLNTDYVPGFTIQRRDN
jgi:RNA-binding protein YhbY